MYEYIHHEFSAHLPLRTPLSFRDSSARCSGPPHNVLVIRTHRVIGRREIALMESSDLVRLECAYDGVQHATVMEQDEVFLVPVVGVDELWRCNVY